MTLRSWGQLPGDPAVDERWWAERTATLPQLDGSLLAYGNGRSYGDVCLNGGTCCLHTHGQGLLQSSLSCHVLGAGGIRIVR